MNAAVRLEPGSAADVDGVMRVMNDSFDSRFGEAWTGAQCAGLLPMPGVWLVVARSGDAIVGFSLSRAIADEAELLLLAVSRSAQRRGVGRLLLDRFEVDAHARGAVHLHLEVRDGNPATQLYTSAGYTLLGRRINYYKGREGGMFDALTLGKGDKAIIR